MGQNFKSNDEQIKSELVSALNHKLGEDVAEVDVMVKNGLVKLTGSVEERYTLEKVLDIARNCKDASSVESWVTIGPNQIDEHQASINLHRAPSDSETRR